MDSEEPSITEEEHLTIEDVFWGSRYASSETLYSVTQDSLIESEESPKMKLFKEGLYSPGSGEICTKYVTMSRSSMLRHVYYEYPSVKDPGIERALLYPEDEKFYDDDGQELYLDLCKKMNLIPVRSFHRDLKKKTVNLRFYGVNPRGIKAMTLALAYNRTVKCVDLTSNFLDHRDACYHLGQMLNDRNVVNQLILRGCKIGQYHMPLVLRFLYTRLMQTLDLSGNNIQDKGLPYLTFQIEKGAVIIRLYLSNNDLTSEGLKLLAEVVEYRDRIKYLDLSWNKFMDPKGPATLFRALSFSKVLVELNMAWTGISVAMELGNLLSIRTLKVLNLSNNKLGARSARVIARALYMAKSLDILDLSGNPFNPSDALYLLVRLKQDNVKLRELRMDHIVVSKEFIMEMKEIMKLDYRQKAVITHGVVLRNYTLPESDIKIITMKRLVYNMKKKQKKLDILLYFLEQNKTTKYLDTGMLTRTLRLYDIHIQEDFMDNFVKLFPGPKMEKTGNRSLNLNTIVDYIHRIWPNKKLPPTPPPTPPPLPPIIKKKEKKKKGRK